MKFSSNKNKIGASPILFVHSLFRSGSTYFYHAIKRTEKYYPYHEPFHEVIRDLANSWSGVSGRSDQIKVDLRHKFMKGGYFDEYSRLLPYLKKTFDERFSFEYFFLEQRAVANDLSAYIETLVSAAPRAPILQCTRTIGRVQWLKLNYESKHIFLLRNPWDQWYSYKVDQYIASTPRIILSQPNIPNVLADIVSFYSVASLQGSTINEQLAYAYTHPLSAETDYVLFFSIWAYAFVMSKRHCDVVLDMDLISLGSEHQAAAVQQLAALDLEGVDLSDTDLPKALFVPREQQFYEIVENQVLEVFRNHDFKAEEILELQNYLVVRRKETFAGARSGQASELAALNDAARLRDVILKATNHTASTTIGLTEALKTREIEITAATLGAHQRQEENESLRAELASAQEELSRLSHLDFAHAEQREELIRARENAARLEDEQARLQVEHQVLVGEYEVAKSEYDARLQEMSSLVDEMSDRCRSIVADRDALSQEMMAARDQLTEYENSVEQLETSISGFEIRLADSKKDLSQSRHQTHLLDRMKGALETELAATNQALENYQNRVTSDIERGIRRSTRPSRRLARVMGLSQRGRAERMDADARTIESFIGRFSDDQLGMQQDGRRQRILLYLSGLTPIVDDFPVFNRGIYELLHPDVARSNMDAFVHFITFGCGEGRTIHPIIDGSYYISQHPEAGVLDMSVIEHFIRFGADKGYSPCALFDVKWYFQQYPDVRTSGYNPVLHFLRHPRCMPHPLFDAELYLSNYADVAAANLNPLAHYLIYGSAEERNPNPWFDSNFYMKYNSDLPSGSNPLSHYVTAGYKEGRHPNAYFKPAHYIATAGDLGGRSALEHYIYVGRFKEAASVSSSELVAKDITKPATANSVTAGRSPIAPRTEIGRQSPSLAPERKIALMVNAFYPHPDEDAGSLEQISFARIFQSLGYDVAYVGILDFATNDKYRDALQGMGVHCISSDDYYNLEEYLFLNADYLQVAFMSRVHWGGAWIDRLRLFCPKAKIIFNTVDLHYIREERQAALAGDAEGQIEAQKTKEMEFKCIRSADVTIVLSTTELDILEREIPGAAVKIVPIMREIGAYNFAQFSERRDIAFVGGFQHQPNVDAVEYFLGEIWPLVLKDLPDLRIRIIGSHLPESLSRRPDQNVDWVGYVPEIDPELDHLKLTVAPLRYGAGAKGKVVSSLARGVPCVASPIAAEGMGLEDGVNIAVGKTPEEFARAITHLYKDQTDWNRLSREGFALIQRDYSLDTGKRLVNEILVNI